MARNGILTLYDINDAKIATISQDDGSALSFNSLVDVPGIQSVSLGFEVNTKELYGDAKVLDVASKIKSATVSARHAQMSLNLYAQLFGNSSGATASGTTPNEVLTWDLLGANDAVAFKLEGQCTYQGGPLTGGSGDAHFTLWKCTIVSFTTEFQSEEYATVSFEAKAIPTINDDKLLTMVENETAAAIS